MPETNGRIPVLYIAPWVDFGGTDKATIDWFRWLDRDRFAPSLITTQPSKNRRLNEIHPFAEEVWPLPEHMSGPGFARFIFDFIHTRGVRVLHVMNSRLGFDLLPDLGALDGPPVVVVQLHVEEPDRSGFVRYVATRYGNLVDGFSLVSTELIGTVEGYDIPTSKLHMIPLGVDAAGEFNPARVRPLDSSQKDGRVKIIYPGRLTEQKDPLLMLDVIKAVVARNHPVQVDVVGDGPLEPAVRARVAELGLQQHVRLHPPTTELPRWLRDSDILLMTSLFEGIPCVIYESLAMGVPVVAPALSGNIELMGDTGGLLVDPRDDVNAYADAVSRLITDREQAQRLGAGGRERMLQSFSTRRMASEHEQLYETLLASSKRQPSTRPERVSKPPTIRLLSRPGTGSPLVTIVMPCFNDGKHLLSALESVFAQDYPAIEVIVVDDGSTDAGTLEVIDRLDRDDRVRVIRQPQNAGPSCARNRAIDQARGRYILPVDADNILLAGSVRRLVDQIQAAGERVGFIYPSFTYFGNRDYTFEPPDYNMFQLLQVNFADTCSLIDREAFDSGLRFDESIGLGHEDWDLFLALAAHDVIGSPSDRPVILYRKHGFTRSDRVEYRGAPFAEEIRARRPELYGHPSDFGAFGAYRGRQLEIKRRWAPALSIISTAPIDFASEPGATTLAGLSRQSCSDLEFVAQCPSIPAHTDCVIRRLPPDLAGSAEERARRALKMARGRFLLITSVPMQLLSDSTFVEKLLRELWDDNGLAVVAYADTEDVRAFPLQVIHAVDPELVPHSLAWRREAGDLLRGEVPDGPGLSPNAEAKALYDAGLNMRWRHVAPAGALAEDGGALSLGSFDPRTDPPRSIAVREERVRRWSHPPAIPSLPSGTVRRWAVGWTPAETLPLTRHVSHDGRTRLVTTSRQPPPGFRIEFDLGSIQHFSPPGTVRLIRRAGRFTTVPRGSAPHPSDEELGYLEQAPLPQLLAVELAMLPNGEETLIIAGERDHLWGQVLQRTALGYIEPFPIEPQKGPPYSSVLLPVLVRCLDGQRRRHVYAVVDPAAPSGHLPLSAELGQLASPTMRGAIPLYIDSGGRVSTPGYQPETPSPSPKRVARWALAPATWRNFGGWQGRARAVARRSFEAPRLTATPHLPHLPASDSKPHPLGYLYPEPGPGRLELLSAIHPVVRDQFLTHHAIEATDLGYECVTRLGYVAGQAPLTGVLGGRRVVAPWTSRFGIVARGGRGPREFL
jgi:glycosyltransferase involved in cell wall biosynthesis